MLRFCRGLPLIAPNGTEKVLINPFETNSKTTYTREQFDYLYLFHLSQLLNYKGSKINS